MPTPTFVSPFTGTVVTPTDVTYEYLTLTESIQLYWPATIPAGEKPLTRIIDVNTSNAAYTITFPQANQGATGTDSLIRNVGSADLTVYNYDSLQSFTIAPGEAFYFYLSDNTTEGGSWQSVMFGAGTSVADAAALAGNNLYVRNSLLAVGFPNVEITSPPTITNNNSGVVYVWQSGTATIDLPTAISLNTGWFIGFRNNGSGTLYFQSQGTSVINTSQTLTTNPGDSGFIMFNKTTNDFFTVGLTAPNVVTFTSSIYDVDNIIGSTFNLTSYAPVIQTYVALSGTRSTNLTVELPPITQIYVFVNNTNDSSYDLLFNVYGSMSAPITVPTNTVVMAICDGTTVQPIYQTSSTTYFLAVDGSDNLPSFSFLSDTSTGMYLRNPNQLGLSANGTEIVDIDNTVPGSALVSVNARLLAELIDGGTF